MKKKPNLSGIHEKEMLVWKPCSSLSNEDRNLRLFVFLTHTWLFIQLCFWPLKVDSYLFTACSKCSYSIEQALALLCINKHDIPVSLMNTNHYVPTPNEWSEEDKIIFEQAYNYHGKNFYKIKQCVNKFNFCWCVQKISLTFISTVCSSFPTNPKPA